MASAWFRCAGHGHANSLNVARESPHELGLFTHVHKKSVVTVVGWQFAVSYIEVVGTQRADDLLGLIAGVEPIGCEADHQKTGLDVGNASLTDLSPPVRSK